MLWKNEYKSKSFSVKKLILGITAVIKGWKGLFLMNGKKVSLLFTKKNI